jgi:hypothetical protein
MTVEPLLARLAGVKKRGAARWVARCPAHEDKSPSLSIVELPDGRILLHDFAGCDVEAVLDALGMQFGDLFPAPLAHNLPAQRSARAHFHAASDVLKIMAHEALIIALAGENIANGVTLDDDDRARVLEAVGLLREAATNV